MSLLLFILLVASSTIMGMGNGPAMVPFFQSDLVDGRAILTLEQMLYALAIAQVTPGQMNLFVTAIGYMLFGVPGALLATLFMILPAYSVLPLMHGYDRLRSRPRIRGLMRGLTCASVGLILAATVSLGRCSLSHPIGWVAFVITLVMSRLVKWKPFPSLVGASCAAMLLLMCWSHS